MRRWIIMLAALLVVSLLPSQGTELSRLCPAAVLMLRADGKQISLETDTGDTGTGETLEDALRDLRDSAPGEVLLDTVENLILTENSRYLLTNLHSLLRPNVRVCTMDGELDAEAAWRYLRVHMPIYKLHDVTEESKLQTLTWEEERFHLENRN